MTIQSFFQKEPSEHNLIAGLLLVLLLIPYALVSAARVASSIHNYSAPLTLYNHLYKNELGRKSMRDVNICVGKEWYRFGTSFFIPSSKQRVQFIKSGFDGLLPQVVSFVWIHHSHSSLTQEPGRFLII